MNRKILYLQYTNPANYPPLEHSSRILADDGWQVRFIGTGAQGAADQLRIPAHPNIEVRQWKFCRSGLRQKFHYLFFVLWAVWTVLFWRPKWVYVSDPLACPPGFLLSLLPGVRVLYHEHDSPTEEPASRPPAFQRCVLNCRSRLARRAQLCVLPNAERIRVFQQSTGTSRPVHCVWNCPERKEAQPAPVKVESKTLRIFFHGSIVPARLPQSLIPAMKAVSFPVELRVAGYETVGSTRYLAQLRQEAEKLGIGDSIKYLGPIALRQQLLEECSRSDVGIAFMPLRTSDINEAAMTGASNKPFDYLACGLALLVADLPDWKRMFVDTGFGRACNPEDPQSIADALQWFAGHLTEARAMGQKGRQRIADEWNYEAQFAPVKAVIEGRNQAAPL